MEKVGAGAMDWLRHLEERIDAGEFARGAEEPSEDVAITGAERLEIGYAIGRRAGRRGLAAEFWDAANGRWSFGIVGAEDDGGRQILRRSVPRSFTLYDEREHADVMVREVDETGTGYVFAVLPRLRPAEVAVEQSRRAR